MQLTEAELLEIRRIVLAIAYNHIEFQSSAANLKDELYERQDTVKDTEKLNLVTHMIVDEIIARNVYLFLRLYFYIKESQLWNKILTEEDRTAIDQIGNEVKRIINLFENAVKEMGKSIKEKDVIN